MFQEFWTLFVTYYLIELILFNNQLQLLKIFLINKNHKILFLKKIKIINYIINMFKIIKVN